MRILIVGDSLSESGGFNDYVGKMWYHHIPSNCTVVNLSESGQSNNAICFSVIREVLTSTTKYDLVIVQWGDLHRLSVYNNKSVYHSQVCYTNTKGVVSPDTVFGEYWKENYTCPHYELLHYLTLTTMLACTLQTKGQPFVFIKGFDNYLKDACLADWQSTSDDYKDNILMRHSLPDDEIAENHAQIHNLYNAMSATSREKWLNLSQHSWIKQMHVLSEEFPEIHSSRADDGRHPNIETNKYYYNKISSFIKSLGLSF